MTNNVWFITGAGRGMGLHITKAALAADHKVVATGRDTDKVAQAVGIRKPVCGEVGRYQLCQRRIRS